MTFFQPTTADALMPSTREGMVVLKRPMMLMGHGIVDAWLLFKDGVLVDVWVQ